MSNQARQHRGQDLIRSTFCRAGAHVEINRCEQTVAMAAVDSNIRSNDDDTTVIA